MQRIIAFVLAEGPVEHGQTEEAAIPPQSAPSYVSASIPQQIVLKREGSVTLKAYPPNILIAESVREVRDVFSEDAFALRSQMIKDCQNLLEKHKAKLKISEEYSLAIVDGYEGSAEQFLSHERAIVRFLKSEPLSLHTSEIAHSLQNQITYGENDLIIVDWDGAFVFQQNGKADSIVDLLQLVNLHLLQYRVLDEELAQRLKRIDKLIRTKAISCRILEPGTFTHLQGSHQDAGNIHHRVRRHHPRDEAHRGLVLCAPVRNRGTEVPARWMASFDQGETGNAGERIRDHLAELSYFKEHFFELMLQMGWLILIFLELYQIFQ